MDKDVKIFHDSETGQSWAVRVIRTGGRYGLNEVLVHEEAGKPLVEFYDTRYEHTNLGQFVSRYYRKTLLERPMPYGLDLQGGAPTWKIEAKCMVRILAWLKSGEAKDRLEYLREELRAEWISYDGLAELQALAEYIEPGDVELLEAAGVEEKS